MALTWPVALAVLFGALLHASWNALVKSSTDKEMDTALIHLIGSLMAIPLVLLMGLPPRSAWPYLVVSITIHIGYYFALTGAYRHGELGLTYPLMRGVAPLLVALSASFTLHEQLSLLAWLGVLGISLGVLTLGLSQHAFDAPKAVAFALANAVIIAVYTVVDGLGVRAAGTTLTTTLQYVATLFMFDGWPFALIILAQRRGALPRYARQRWPLASVGALASLGSYGIALWAMTRAPVAMVVALREVSVLFAVVIGALVLGEALTLRRIVGALVIIAGVMALRLG
ncbi:DMT family transporter [Rhodoferax sp.]|uniref:DMT family transporter n=1 Tax=Rhodoferax sp. TaxID=50421 RepID=UPI0008B7AE01|nr:DMT family transporter [Rhodoferax sp.]OGB37718.1 MAG: phosphonate utilization protein [Burkholderiales bacterium RIFOXYC2_FULL_59_8]OGB58858.1 MAG: phosphonate utilization protein [Burkholderiales bacterium RIFOXYD12_FULL_59_19]OGB79893.1 MAG: phosphonate utilization protein [Burkholderiales bacterium RIFOXYC12_FULL_60_6]MDO8318444.1 DMT family transporter [Rhodoferax sp.]MDP2679700.1 DMT family transporter [Rhodoferax sp.]